MLVVSLSGAGIETGPLLLQRRGDLSICMRDHVSFSAGAVWVLSLISVWTLYAALERHVGWRLTTDQLERRWALDLSRPGVLRALDDVDGVLRRFRTRAFLHLHAPAVIAWTMVVCSPVGWGHSAPTLLLSANGAALIFIGFGGLSAPSKLTARIRPTIVRSMSRVTELRAIGAEGAAYRHLWGRVVHHLPLKARGAWSWARVLHSIVMATVGGVCFAVVAVWPGSAVCVGLLLLAARALLHGRLVSLRHRQDSTALEEPSKRPPAPAATTPNVPAAILSVENLVVGGDHGEAIGAISFGAVVGTLTWVVASAEGEARLMVEALLGLRRAERGRLKLGDDHPDPADGRRWRTRCAFVPLRTTLIAGSLRDNLLVSAPEATREALLIGVVAASPHGASSRLLDMMDTRMNAACRITPGELRTISFARAVLRRPELIVIESEPEGLPVAEAAHFERLVRALVQRCIVVAVTSSPCPRMQPTDTRIVLDDRGR